jgi:asparagine synthase (glutamine-hydrolysing)
LGTEHTELYVEPAEAMGVIPRLASIYDEPFADSSQIPELLLAELTRRHVTVALSGDGGDEVFGGYNRYVWVQRIWKTIGWTPAPARRMLGSLARMLPARSANAVFRILNPILPASLRHELPGDKLHKLSPLLGSADAREFYRHLASQWQQPALLVPDVSEPVHPLFEPHGFQDFVAEMMYLDSISFLPDDVLTKVDRATMAGGLESRAPFLDVRVAEFAWRLPSRMKIRAGQGKWILRELLSRSVPRALWQRPKMGFGIPLDSWLRGEMRDWAEELLSEKRLRESGLLQPAPVRAKWREHLSGRRDWQYQLWDVLMFQSWLEASRARASVRAAVGAPV